MACFLVPATEAVKTTVASKVMKSKAENTTEVSVDLGNGTKEKATTISFAEKLGWLSKLLWGGSALLAFEHLWHGEIIPWFPFLTAASDPSEMQIVFEEMQSVGGSMAILLTLVWVCMLIITNYIKKKALIDSPNLSKGGSNR